MFMVSRRGIKKSMGRPAIGAGTPVMTRLRPEQLARLDSWIANQPDPKPTRPEAIRRLLDERLNRSD